MRTHVSFQHPAEFVPVSKDDPVLARDGATWFSSLLQRVAGLRIDGELRQEDWDVVLFVIRDGRRFWIGLSTWPDSDHGWLAHIHHGSCAWLQRFSSSGQTQITRLIRDIHDVLAGEPSISAVTWYEESDMKTANPQGYPTPSIP
jgi:hypothetical protein